MMTDLDLTRESLIPKNILTVTKEILQVSTMMVTDLNHFHDADNFN